MPSRASATRRQFLQTAAAASAAGLVLAHPGAAFGLTKQITNYAVELDGFAGARLAAIELPRHELQLAAAAVAGKIEKAGSVAGYTHGPFKASYAISEASDLLTWILSLAQRTVDVRAGRIVLADPQLAVRRRIDWTGGHITSVKFPKLSAAEPSRPLTADVEWEADSVTFAEGAGLGKKARPFPAASKASPLQTANFRLVGLPGVDGLADIELPTITAVKPAQAYGGKLDNFVSTVVGELKLGFTAAGWSAASKVAQKVIKDGKLTDDEHLDLAIELLDDTKTRRASMLLTRCALRSFSEGKHGADAAPGCALSFTVERFDLKFG